MPGSCGLCGGGKTCFARWPPGVTLPAMQLVPHSSRPALTAGLACVAMGAFSLAGWWLKVPPFDRWLGSEEFMKANSALGFICAGGALALNVTPVIRRWEWLVAGLLAGLVTLLGGLTTVEYLLGRDLGLDELLVNDVGGDELAPPGRMSINGTVGFLLAGSSLFLLNGQPQKRHRPMMVGLLACVLFGLALFSLSGNLLEMPTSYRWEGAKPMALTSALSFMILSAGFMILAHGWSQRDGLAQVRWMGPAVGTGVLTVTLLMWQALRAQEEREIDRVMAQQVREARQLLAAQAQARLLTLTRVARRWESQAVRRPGNWDFDAQLYLSHYPDLKALVWLADDLAVREAAPRGIRGKLLQLTTEPSSKPAAWVRALRQRPEGSLTPTLDLGGERGFLMVVPMTQGTNSAGFVVGAFQARAFVETALGPVRRGHWFKLTEQGQEIFRSSSAPAEAARPHVADLRLGDAVWEMRAWPTSTTLAELHTLLAVIALSGGSTLAILLGLAIQLTQTARARESEVRKINRTLQAEVSERKQAQDLLRESQQRLQAILDNSFAVIYLKDAQGRYLLINQRFETLFHIQREAILGRTDHDIFPKLMADAFRANDERTLQSRTALTIEEIAPQDDGLHTYVSIKFPLLDARGEPYGVCGISTDITERKRAEAELRASHVALEFAHHRLRGIIEGTQDQIAALDLRFRFITFNSAYKDGFRREFSREIEIGMRLSDPLAHVPEEREEQLALWARALRGEAFTAERSRHAGTEAEQHFEISFSPIRNETGELLGAAQHMRDITARQKAEAERARLLAELARRNGLLEAANHELEAFSYSVSHDLRAPLRHMDGFAGLLQRTANNKLDEKERRYLNLIMEAAKRMGRLIDDLLEFSRMGRAELRHADVDMSRLVQTVLHDLEPDTAGRNIHWQIGPLPVVRGDAALLRQVWMNLLANAVKYTRPRGEANIAVGCDSREPLEHAFFARDNGVGFEMKYATHLFGVFQRLHRAEDFEGTGIGLANVRRIVARHGGRTWAEGAPNVGAVVWFSLPRSPVQTQPAGAQGRAGEVAATK